jgi:hypothetical protein
MVRAVDQSTFQPKIGFKTRYGIVANPFSHVTENATTGAFTTGELLGAITKDNNGYYRRVMVDNIL